MCEILKETSCNYQEVSYAPTPKAVHTYLCIATAKPDTVYMPFFHIRKFFEENNYLSSDTTIALDDTAIKFLKYAESSYPAIDESKFKVAFNRSIKDHCTLINASDFKIES